MISGTTMWAVEDKRDGHTIPNYGKGKAIFASEDTAASLAGEGNGWFKDRFVVVEVEVWKKEDIQILLDKAKPF